MNTTTQTTQTIAYAATLSNKVFSGYGHYDITIDIYTNTGNESYTYTTTNIQLIDMLKDDDNDIIELAKERLINRGLSNAGIEKSNDFKYIY